MKEFYAVFTSWLVLAVLLVCLAEKVVTESILYYDEALAASMARDFVLNQHRSDHVPGTATAEWFGRPAPTFLQGYCGALKCWMLIPSFAVLGPHLNVLRWTDLGWCVVSLLFFMLWTWRLMGLAAALLAGPFLALDPSFFFISVHDWGPVVPSFLCRFAGFFLLLLGWQNRRSIWLFFAGLAFGLGFYNKIDFVVILAGTGLALFATNAKAVVSMLSEPRGKLALFGTGFLVGALPMVVNFWRIVQGVLAGGAGGGQDEMAEKLNTAWTMFDGSYFYRLMDQGGVFTKMFDARATVWSPFGLVFALAFVLLAFHVGSRLLQQTFERLPAFLLVSTLLLLLGTLLMPQAVRIHHWTLVYPFPHLIIATAALWLWHNPPARPVARLALRACVMIAIAGVLTGHLLALRKTQRLIVETGGRGRWSNSLTAFAEEVKDRSDLTIVSLDWGFNEQLKFLTDGPRLHEPIWHLQAGGRYPISKSSNFVYLVYSPDYTLFPYGKELLGMAYGADPRQVRIQPYKDRQGDTAFLAVRFMGE